MKKIVVLLIICSNGLFSQNLVPNPDFEVFSQCPNQASQISYATPWIGITSNSSDYFNSCSSTYGVPYSVGNRFQPAKSGNAFSGIWLYNGVNNNFREYIHTQLIQSLTSNGCYLITFYTNKSNTGNYAINNLALHFSQNTIPQNGTGDVLNLTEHVKKMNNPIIADTINWVEIKGVYTAVGNENYITIGNFNNDSNTDTLNYTNDGYPGAYYYIDDVSVIAISDLPNSMAANAGPDIDLTLGDSVFIGQEISNLNCTWSILGGAEIADSISGIYVQPTENTTYVVEQNLCGVTTYDTVTVFVHGVGIEESSPLTPSKGGVALSPNPNNGSFDIDLSKLNVSIQDLSILDASGRIVYQEKNIASQNKLSIQTHLEKGVYFLRLSSEKGIFEEKLVIQ